MTTVALLRQSSCHPPVVLDLDALGQCAGPLGEPRRRDPSDSPQLERYGIPVLRGGSCPAGPSSRKPEDSAGLVPCCVEDITRFPRVRLVTDGCSNGGA